MSFIFHLKFLIFLLSQFKKTFSPLLFCLFVTEPNGDGASLPIACPQTHLLTISLPSLHRHIFHFNITVVPYVITTDRPWGHSTQANRKRLPSWKVNTVLLCPTFMWQKKEELSKNLLTFKRTTLFKKKIRDRSNLVTYWKTQALLTGMCYSQVFWWRE